MDPRGVRERFSSIGRNRFDTKKTVIEMKKYVVNFLKDERGLTTVEYAVAGGLISLAVVGAFQALGVTVDGIIRGIDGALAP